MRNIDHDIFMQRALTALSDVAYIKTVVPTVL